MPRLVAVPLPVCSGAEKKVKNRSIKGNVQSRTKTRSLLWRALRRNVSHQGVKRLRPAAESAGNVARQRGPRRLDIFVAAVFGSQDVVERGRAPLARLCCRDAIHTRDAVLDHRADLRQRRFARARAEQHAHGVGLHVDSPGGHLQARVGVECRLHRLHRLRIRLQAEACQLDLCRAQLRLGRLELGLDGGVAREAGGQLAAVRAERRLELLQGAVQAENVRFVAVCRKLRLGEGGGG